MGSPLHPVLPDSHADLLADAHYAHMATVRPDGAPQSSVMWFDWDGRVIRITHTRSRQKFRNLEHEGRVSFSIHDPASPLRALEVRGRVVDVTDDDDVASFYKGLQHRYAMDYPIDDAAERVVIAIEPTKFVAVGGGQIVATSSAG